MDTGRLSFLAQLPTLLNSSLKAETVIDTALKHLRLQLDSEAATVFLSEESSEEVTFWALHGGDSKHLIGKRMPARAGIIGWVLANKQSLLVNDVQKDPRFFSQIDKESEFSTKSIICAPLVVRGTKLIGAIQVLNKNETLDFSEDDLHFVEKFAHQAALAIDNAQLFHDAQEKSHQLAALSRRKDEMISVIIHEFQTPINILQNCIELLSSGILDEETKDKVSETLQSGLSRLTTVISRIRDVSFSTSEKLTVEKQVVSMQSLFTAMSCQFEEVLKQRNLKFSTDIGVEIDKVHADPALLIVAIKNLVANAIRFTPDGGSIILSAKKITGLVEISISDTGIGIEASEYGLIFEKFYEVTDASLHSSGTYEFKSCGLGLGLPTVRAILEAHGSSINLESSLEKGSTFSFRLSPVE